jgi:hypothetical protein
MKPKRRGLVRFRNPESRAAHCRNFYALDFWLAQAEIFDFMEQSCIQEGGFVLRFSHLKANLG